MKKLSIFYVAIFVTCTLAIPYGSTISYAKTGDTKLNANFIQSTNINSETARQRKAVAAAKKDLLAQANSRKGLIEQLKSEGFSSSDATYGADHSGANWNSQALKRVRDHLSYEDFTKSRMQRMLISEGFTNSQAAYGVLHGCGCQ